MKTQIRIIIQKEKDTAAYLAVRAAKNFPKALAGTGLEAVWKGNEITVAGPREGAESLAREIAHLLQREQIGFIIGAKKIN